MTQFTVSKPGTLREVLALELGISKSKAKEIINSRTVFVNDKRVWMANHELRRGDRVETAALQKPDAVAEVPISFLYEDDFIIAADKPPGIVTNESPNSLEALLRKQTGNEAIVAIHRLDAETSGVILFAKSEGSFERFKELWLTKTIDKYYLALAFNAADFKDRRVNIRIDGKSAVSLVRTLQKNQSFSYFQVKIETGRKHQIRKHLAFIGYPVIGDKEYYTKLLESPLLKGVKRQMLHCHVLSFPHPDTGKTLTLRSSPPKDFVSLAESIGLRVATVE